MQENAILKRYEQLSTVDKKKVLQKIYEIAPTQTNLSLEDVRTVLERKKKFVSFIMICSQLLVLSIH